MDKTNYQPKAITRLHLFDVKAQKKTIPFKKFCAIPLTYEETLKENFVAFKKCHFPFVISSSPQQRRSSSLGNLRKIAEPKRSSVQHTDDGKNSEKAKEIEKLMKKCGKILKSGSRFRGRMKRLEKHSERCLEEIQKRVELIILEGASALGYR